MKLAAAILLAATAIAGPVQSPLHAEAHRETRDEAVLSAAHLAKGVTTGTMASVFPESAGVNAGHPYALMESHAPCHPNGSLTFISMPISLMTRNIKANDGRATYTLQTPLEKGVSEYGRPRVAFIGNLTVLNDIDVAERERLATCYTKYHPDARWWLPDDPRGAHTAHWARLDINDIYYIGGFGTTGYIGHLPLDKYAQAMEA